MKTDAKHIRIADFDYPLPDEKIPKFPLKKRDGSKLLIYQKGKITADGFASLPAYLPQGALMVFNNTKVIQARMLFRKATGALIEIFLMEPAQPTDYELMFQTNGTCAWYCMVGNLKKWKEGVLTRSFEIKGEAVELLVSLNREKEDEVKAGGTNHWIDFQWNNEKVSFAEILDVIGQLPIPPYLNRETEESDKTTYQTVYSKIKGSVAAPTAGLHFTPEVLAAINAAGIEREELTLHVGAGTFKPVKSEEIEGHNMHTEYIVVRKETLHQLLHHNCQAIAVGTTSVRTLESLYYMGAKLEVEKNLTEADLHVKQWEPYDYKYNNEGLAIIKGEPFTTQKAIENLLTFLEQNHLPALHTGTQIIIAPGFRYKIVQMLVTNFHQPQSTLLLLVSAFIGEDWRKVYDYALNHNFRFLSYGDSSLLIP